MLIVVSTAIGMVIWVVLWSLGAKGWDGAMVFMLVLLFAATAKIVAAALPGNRRTDDAIPDAAPFN
jgi:hypothetical protein